MPRDDRHQCVDSTVDRRGHELDATTVGPADHSRTWIANAVELRFGLRRQPVEQLLHVTRFVVDAVDLHGPGRLGPTHAGPT